jgi:hypothetical protein
MHIESIKRWQWMILGALLGLGMGYSRQMGATDLPSLGEGINEQALFERRVLSKAGGSPLFKDIRVSRQTLNDGSGANETLDIVSGKSVPDSARAGEHYKPMWFAAHIPYQPAIQLAQLASARFPDPVSYWHKIPKPTVLDFLELAHASAGVSYANAWWDSYPLRSFTLAGFVLIGIVLPSLINLYYFQSLFRPKEEKAVSLAGVHGSTTAGPAPVEHELSEAELEHLHNLEAELEATMRGDAPSAAPEAAPAIRTLPTDAIAASADQPHDDRHYRAKPEDYYPTEERSHPPKDH